MSFYAKQREKRIESLKSWIETQEQVPLNDIIKDTMREYSVTKKKVYEYLEDLETMEYIEIDEDSETVTWIDES